jgi:hypothetical protein
MLAILFLDVAPPWGWRMRSWGDFWNVDWMSTTAIRFPRTSWKMGWIMCPRRTPFCSATISAPSPGRPDRRPIIAGWLSDGGPALLWILLGSIFIGGVHDSFR